MATSVRSYAKINLGLAVGPLRSDGFHGLATVYQTVNVYDILRLLIRVSTAPTRIKLTSNHAGVPRTETGDAERNTAYKMVARALARMGISAEVEIHIEKRLPVQGGLGAGSANAVAALLGLERELGWALPDLDRLKLAAEVGSDVPLFLIGGTVLGQGRGEEVSPLPDSPPMACVVAVPGVGVSTRLAFAALDARLPQGLKPLSSEALHGRAEARPLQSKTGRAEAPYLKSESGHHQARPLQNDPAGSLTFAQPGDRLSELSRVYASVFTTSGAEHGPSGINRRTVDLAENPLLALVRTGIENDFEEVAFSQHPSLRSTKRDLMGSDPGNGSALYAALSGSGSALFGLYESQADACAAQQRVQQSGTQALLTETLPRAEYWASMFAE